MSITRLITTLALGLFLGLTGPAHAGFIFTTLDASRRYSSDP